MDIVEIRRSRLRAWFSKRTIPPSEKSYLSQLMTGKASFGERAARRLERDYGMGDGFLDQRPAEEPEQELKVSVDSADAVFELVDLFARCDAHGRDFILEAARSQAADAGSDRNQPRAANGKDLG